MPARWGIPLLTALDATTGAILVAESGRSASGAPCATSLPWGAEAVAAWRLARRTLPHALPLVWGRLSEVAQPSVCVLGFDEGGRPSSVDGSSLGLAFALLLGTEALGLRLPPDLAVTGALTVTGEVVAVGGLEPKINSLTAFAPGIRRLLVPKAQVTDAARIHAPHLQIIGVATVAEAVSTAFGGDLAAALVRAGETAEARAELAESFFELALDRHHAVPSWAPVAEAATLALATWTEANPAERFRLAFARAVAARHAGRTGAHAHPLPLPDAAARASLPIDTRTLILAHLVQQSHDHGVPAPMEVLEVAAPLAATDLEAWPAQIRLAGAVGRLRALVGDAAAGLAAARAAAEAWAVRRAWGEVSYPLCEWYRLAGAVGDAAAFEAAHALHRRAAEAIGVHGLRFVRLAEARARVCLLRPGPDGAPAEAEVARALLDGLLADAEAPGHVPRAAARWRARLALRCGEAVAPAWTALLAQGDDRVQPALLALDRALGAAGALTASPADSDSARAAREAAADADPQVRAAFADLRAVAGAAQALPTLLDRGLTAAAVAHLFPY